MRSNRRPVQQLDVEPVERHRRGSEVHRSRTDVGRGHLLRIAAGVHGLDAAAGTDVENACRRGRGRSAQQRQRGLPDAEHVVGSGLGGAHAAVRIRDDPPSSVSGVERSNIEQRPHCRSGAGENPGCDGVGNRQWCDGVGDVGLGAVVDEQEQAHQNTQRTTVPARVAYRHRLAATEGSVGVVAEQRQYAVGVVPRPLEGLT